MELSTEYLPNGVGYPLVGGDDGTPLCRNQLRATQTACLHLAAGTGENAPTPTSRVQAVLAGLSQIDYARSSSTAYGSSR